MRKPRDFDSELRALNDKAKQLRARKIDQLGELVVACDADALPIEQLAGALLEAVAANAGTKVGWRKRGRSSFGRETKLGVALTITRASLIRVVVLRNRIQLRRARDDKRDWIVKRRERTRKLIELGGLVAKAGLVELTSDDRAVLFGMMVEAAAKLRHKDRESTLTLWRRQGRRTFDAAKSTMSAPATAGHQD